MKREKQTGDIDLERFGLSVACAKCAIMPRPHRHDELEMMVIERGSMTYLFGGQRIVVPPRCLAVHWAAVPHQTIDLTPDCTYSLSLKLPVSMLLNSRVPQRFIQAILHGKHFTGTPVDKSYSDLELLRRWENDLKSTEVLKHQVVVLEAEARLIRLALDLEEASREMVVVDANSRVSTRPIGKAVQMAAFLTEFHADELCVADVARSVGLHRQYAMDLFRKTFGMTIVEYLTQHRVWHAQRLLANTDKAILEIAFDSGFGSASRFYSTFKELVGQSPKTYRRLVRAGKA